MTTNEGVEQTFLLVLLIMDGHMDDLHMYVGMTIGLPSMQKREIVESKWLYHYFVNDVKIFNYWWDDIKLAIW